MLYWIMRGISVVVMEICYESASSARQMLQRIRHTDTYTPESINSLLKAAAILFILNRCDCFFLEFSTVVIFQNYINTDSEIKWKN